jgi:MerR family transcriptional regulator, copper efflux regulator
MIAGMTSASVMTIGRLSRRAGVPVKVLREYEDMGLIYTVGRSAGNYRLFDEDALWCVGVVSGLRTLGLTLSEIQELASNYLAHTGEPVGPRLAGVLKVVRARTERRIAELQGLPGCLALVGDHLVRHRDTRPAAQDSREPVLQDRRIRATWHGQNGQMHPPGSCRLVTRAGAG